MPIFVQLTDRFDHPVWVNLQWVNQIFVQNGFTVVSFNGGDGDVCVKEKPEDICKKVHNNYISLV